MLKRTLGLRVANVSSVQAVEEVEEGKEREESQVHLPVDTPVLGSVFGRHCVAVWLLLVHSADRDHG